MNPSRTSETGGTGGPACAGCSAVPFCKITFCRVLTLPVLRFVALQRQGFALRLGNVLHRQFRMNTRS